VKIIDFYMVKFYHKQADQKIAKNYLESKN